MTSNPSLAANPRVEDWIIIRTDDFVEVHSGKVEIGQRITTAVALVVAGELGVPFDRIAMVSPRTGVSADEGYTSGSNSMEQSGHAARLAAATARCELIARAAQRLGVDAATLEVHDGLVRSRETNRTLRFGELVRDRPLSLPIDPNAPTLAGVRGDSARPMSVEPLHLRAHVTGTSRFVHDLRPEGVLHARVVRPPHYHASLDALAQGIEADLEGARLVRDGSFLAVTADDEHLAVRAAARVAAAARWNSERGLGERPVSALLAGNRRQSFPVREWLPREEPVPEPPPDGPRTVRAVYERPYQMHASLAPSAALAHLAGGVLTVWTHSQGLYPLRGAIAEILGLDPNSVQLVHAPGAGCYGHNGSDDAALEAALVARAFPGRPVLLKWSREDEHAWEPYGPAMRIELRADIDDSGDVRYWSHDTCSDTHVMRARRTSPGRRRASTSHRAFAPNPFARPPRPPTSRRTAASTATPPRRTRSRRPRIVKHLVHDLPLRVSALRTLGAYANVFAAESFMDELACEAGEDPLDYRRRHLEDARTRAVLDAAAERFGWTAGAAGSGPGIGRGIAVARYKNMKSYCAAAVEVEVGDDAKVVLRRAVVAVDAGEIVDPDGLAAQLEGGFVQAASWDASRSGDLGPGRHHEPRLGQLPDPALRRYPGDRDRARGSSRRAIPRGRRSIVRPHRGRDRERGLRRHRGSCAAPAAHPVRVA